MKEKFSVFNIALVGIPTVSLVFAGFLFLIRKDVQPSSQNYLVMTTPPALVSPHAHPPGEDIYKDSQITTAYVTITEDSWYVGSSYGILANAPFEAFHHATVYVIPGPGRKILLTPKGKQTMVMKGNERYPQGYGYYLPKGTKLELEARFHNLTEKTYRGVFFELTLDIVPAKKAPENMKHMVLYDLGMDQLWEEIFTVPAQTNSYILSSDEKVSSKSYLVFQEEGTITRLGAHFHAEHGGKWLTAFLNGEEFYTFYAAQAKELGVADSEQYIIPVLVGSPFLRTVKKGDKITFSVSYDNPSEYPVTDAMGKLRVYFVPENQPKTR